MATAAARTKRARADMLVSPPAIAFRQLICRSWSSKSGCSRSAFRSSASFDRWAIIHGRGSRISSHPGGQTIGSRCEAARDQSVISLVLSVVGGPSHNGSQDEKLGMELQ